MTKKEAAKAIEELLSDRVGIDINISEDDVDGVYDVNTLESYVDIDRAISEQCDIVYYSRAMDFLEKNDPSLKEAFEIAEEMGYKLNSLSSEVLASLLNYRYMYNNYADCRDEIEDILRDIDDEDEYEE